MTQSSLVGVVVKRHCLLKATLQKSVFVSPLHSRTRLHFICQWSRLFAQDQDSKHFSSQRPANHRRFGISFIFPSSVCKTWKHVVQIRSKKEEENVQADRDGAPFKCEALKAQTCDITVHIDST